MLDLSGPGSDPSSQALGRADDLGELLDARARAEYRRRLAELEDELVEAEAYADVARAERARVEREVIAAELASALGLGGRARRADQPAERAPQSRDRTHPTDDRAHPGRASRPGPAPHELRANLDPD